MPSQSFGAAGKNCQFVSQTAENSGKIQWQGKEMKLCSQDLEETSWIDLYLGPMISNKIQGEHA